VSPSVARSGQFWPASVEPAASGEGYDGQFSLALAIDPRLSGPVRSALDLPSYRARRIAWSGISWLLARGDPRRTAFALVFTSSLFLGIAAALLSAHLARSGAAPWWALLPFFSLGAIDSTWRMTGDGVLASWLLIATLLIRNAPSWSGGALLALAMLQKETALLVTLPATIGAIVRRQYRLLAGTLAGLALVALWWWTVEVLLGDSLETAVRTNLDLPLRGLLSSFGQGLARLSHPLSGLKDLLFLALQLALLLGVAGKAVDRIRSKRWDAWQNLALWGAAGFALLGLTMSFEVWREHWAYTRVLLPMAFLAAVEVPERSHFSPRPLRAERISTAALLGLCGAGVLYFLYLVTTGTP